MRVAKAEALAYLEAGTSLAYAETRTAARHTWTRRWRLLQTQLELEAVVEFGVDLAGVVVVEASEGDAVVEQDAIVAYVDRGDGGGEFVVEGFADGEIDGGVLREVGVGVTRIGWWAVGIEAAVDEAGAVVDVGGGEGAPGEGSGEADVEGVALVVIDGDVAGGDVALG
jgi:hypothetical protein